MNTWNRNRWALGLAISLSSTVLCGSRRAFSSQDQGKSTTSVPTMFIIGDSTVNNHGNGLLGWGDPIAAYFDKTKIKVENRARGGRSSRTYQTEDSGTGSRDVKKGDFLLIQFGPTTVVRSPRAAPAPRLKERVTRHRKSWIRRPARRRSSTPTAGTCEGISPTLRKGCATPIVLSRFLETFDGRPHGSQSHQTTTASGQPKQQSPSLPLFIDLNEIVAKRYEEARPQR